jgi:exosortase K
MFIVRPMNPTTRAPEERNVSRNEFRSSGAGKSISQLAFYKHCVPTGLRRQLERISSRVTRKFYAQLIVVLLCAAALKLYYSTASVNQLRWILAPTTFAVELVTGSRFEFESYAGYINSERSFLIAASCAGVNFLITSFLMLSLGKLWRNRSQNIAWGFIPAAALLAYLATLVANTVRISTALRLHAMPHDLGWLSPNQLHRFEGIFIYFGFLLLLFMVSERMNYRTGSCSDRTLSHSSENPSGPTHRFDLFRQSLFPLLIYYTTTLGIPLANGAYRPGTVAADFWEHSLFVLLIPLLIIIPFAAFRSWVSSFET